MPKQAGWTEFQSSSPKHVFHNDEYTAFVTLFGQVRTWVVLKGSAVLDCGGGRDSELSWDEAKEDAERAIATFQVSDRRPFFVEEI